jgi:hypothetical protein
MKIHAIPPVLALAVLVGLGSAGCGKKLKNTIIPNQPPTVRLTWAPIDTKSRVFYVYRLSWVGYDPDGRVARFEYAIDPPTETDAVINWISTTRNEETIQFVSAAPESGFYDPKTQRYENPVLSEQPHVFAIRAVDNLGVCSAGRARLLLLRRRARRADHGTPAESPRHSPSDASGEHQLDRQ